MEKKKKPFYKKWWVWVIAVFVIAGVAGAGEEETSEPEGNNQTQVEAGTAEESTSVAKVEEEGSEGSISTEQQPVEEKEPEKEAADVPAEYKSALRKAKTYSDMMHMSKAGLYDQLTSEYGEKFSAEAAQYAIDNLDVDYKANALEKAKDYQEMMAMSPSAIYDQLISEYGEKFTAEEAQHAIDNLE
ncbi:MAG: Ltp family lipoprotein [Turicibacter sp.]